MPLAKLACRAKVISESFRRSRTRTTLCPQTEVFASNVRCLWVGDIHGIRSGSHTQAVGSLRGITARRIATNIGYSPGTLYNVFVNLEDLIVQLNIDTLNEL